ncbi:helix-turn-helix domain-containing protein [Sinorhizobium meliloti]|uniref:helix-turn-helix domain-containing protein n=1 Tax=Rhizobium meliloti TaxID=382 RepID=UPI000FD750A7|nr:helix-turn-helix transcriptional regulator [Sinorhizobium meliloti]RVI91800.1 XRE family transcriptional regulator [Sinorhizobium meliloti]
MLGMPERKYGKTYLREWREYRGLSLRRLADRLELDGPDETFSHTSIARIEKGLQPYSQPILEAIAAALDVSVTDLLSVDPTKEGEVVDLMRLIDDKNRAVAIRMLKALTGTDG